MGQWWWWVSGTLSGAFGNKAGIHSWCKKFRTWALTSLLTTLSWSGLCWICDLRPGWENFRMLLPRWTGTLLKEKDCVQLWQFNRFICKSQKDTEIQMNFSFLQNSQRARRLVAACYMLPSTDPQMTRQRRKKWDWFSASEMHKFQRDVMLAGLARSPQQLLSKALFYVAAVHFPRASGMPLLITAAINQFSSPHHRCHFSSLLSHWSPPLPPLPPPPPPPAPPLLSLRHTHPPNGR